MVQPGEFAPVPTVETNTSPLERTANDIIVADASVLHIGIGTSITLSGVVKAACHYDLKMHRATIEADGVVILKDGVVQV